MQHRLASSVHSLMLASGQVGWQPSRMRRIAAQRSLVLLVGMLGHPGWSWTVVADDGRTVTVRPAEVHVLSRNPQVELVPCRRR
jgi:hypothetical protein